jgi:hypothetical protein
MRIKKDLVVMALAAFCLTATLFMILPTKSNPGVGEYDPWVDLKEDGTIDIYDAIILGNAYGTSGDPTKNVTVTNWPYYASEPAFRAQGFSYNTSISNSTIYVVAVPVDVDGYSRMSISIEIFDCSYHSGPDSTTVALHHVEWGESWGAEFPQGSLSVTYDGTSYPVHSTQIPALFETKYYECNLYFLVSSEHDSGWVMWLPHVYLRNEEPNPTFLFSLNL